MVCPGFRTAMAPEGLGGWVLLTAFPLSLCGGPAPTKGTGTQRAVRCVSLDGVDGRGKNLVSVLNLS